VDQYFTSNLPEVTCCSAGDAPSCASVNWNVPARWPGAAAVSVILPAPPWVLLAIRADGDCAKIGHHFGALGWRVTVGAF